MRPTISYEGKSYPVESINWCDDGVISHASFTDDEGNFHTAMRIMFYEQSEGYQEHGVLKLNLEDRVKWGEVNAAGNNLD